MKTNNTVDACWQIWRFVSRLRSYANFFLLFLFVVLYHLYSKSFKARKFCMRCFWVRSPWPIGSCWGLRHVVWRDSVGVRSSRSGLKSECADIFSSEPDIWLLRHSDEPQRGWNSSLWLQSRSVLSSFGVVLMSCRVNFHVVRSALQYSACRI